MKRKLISLILVLAMCISMITVTSATNAAVPYEAQTAAAALYQLGLFRGTGTDSEGNPVFSLEKSMNRQEAVTMLVRLLGKETEALNGTWETPFTDVAEWAKPYVGYAYVNGLTNGMSATKFGGTSSVTATQYLTFVLRALGYDSSTDFKWDAAWELSDKIGLTSGQYNAENNTSFHRADSTIISYSGLKTKLKDSNVTLVDRMVETGAVDAVKAGALGLMGYKVPTSLIIQDISTWSNGQSELQVGQCAQLDVTIYPAGAASGITWKSSDSSVASVDKWGKVTALKKGTATITATTYNNVQATHTISVPNVLADLKYQLTADGKGYEVIGGDVNAYSAHIPATYKGLPVVSIKGGAFKECSNLTFFTVEQDHPVFYTEGGVIFTDIPEKTLVCFPSAYSMTNSYMVPADTVAIAPYAFAGVTSLQYLTMQEGLKSLGDYAFYGVGSTTGRNRNLTIFAPKSLSVIGKYLLQNQKVNVAIYAPSGAEILTYASRNQIPNQAIADADSGLLTVKMNIPTSMEPSQIIPVKDENVISYGWIGECGFYGYSSGVLEASFDLSSYQDGFSGEVRLMLEAKWAGIIPDVNGKTEINCAPQTGLYGAGYTEGNAILRGYDLNGNLVAMQYISGNFSFCFPGAYNLGVEDGTNTTLTVLPVEPIYISSSGTYPIQPENWYRLSDGNIFQYFVVQYPHSYWRVDYPSDAYAQFTQYGGGAPDFTRTTYAVFSYVSRNPLQMDMYSKVNIAFEGAECLLENEEMVYMAASGFGQTEKHAQKTYEQLRALKETMVGVYYPMTQPVQRIKVNVSNAYAHALHDGSITINNDDSNYVRIHEMVHAIDLSIPAVSRVAASAWLEGRAEYITFKMCDLMGYEYVNMHEKNWDWSFLSEDDKADFFRYYYFSTNRETNYSVGYHFFCYLNETYGEDISSKIMENMANLAEYDTIGQSEVKAALFKKCVEDATEVGVFQNFVRDVIEK